MHVGGDLGRDVVLCRPISPLTQAPYVQVLLLWFLLVPAMTTFVARARSARLCTVEANKGLVSNVTASVLHISLTDHFCLTPRNAGGVAHG